MRRWALNLPLPVRFHGILDDQPLAAILRNAHVLVIPSQYEGFGIAYLEGMAHGLPALGTRVGALPELISDGIDGFLIAPGGVASLSGQLSSLAGDRELLARMGRAALAEIPDASYLERVHRSDQGISGGDCGAVVSERLGRMPVRMPRWTRRRRRPH